MTDDLMRLEATLVGGGVSAVVGILNAHQNNKHGLDYGAGRWAPANTTSHLVPRRTLVRL
ncbi:MAG: hypothetical protein LBD72_03290 [Puniceicoccales bacterium]|nr:hypothetical protein [Puniceicoccales bacterium]